MTRLMAVLGIAGLIPFVVASLMYLTQISLTGFAPQQLFVTYSAVILAFLTGSLWGRETHALQNHIHDWVMAVSNLLCLMAWASLLVGHLSVTLWMLMLGYIATLLVERRQAKLIGIEPDYLKLRLGLTSVAVVCHGLMLVGGG
ncbi:DUF3429 domain-containing protein [Shewanella waksmanii]|uniref:DUF3429 domain-containing protein n=1 Tax=Shewanella waksmanii TaxID=213783 RepID=UPI00373644E8